MAKITIPDILTNFASSVSINARFQQIEDEFNNNVLYRVNPVGEPNQIVQDIDMAGNDILNVGNLSGIVAAIASQVVFTPGGGIASSDVQAALLEVDSEKAKVAGDSFTDFNVKDLIVAGSVDGRDVAVDGVKLDTVATGANVTDSTSVNTAGAVMHTDVVPTDGLVVKTANETYSTVKINSTATADPGGTDNFAAGYSINSLWTNTTGGGEKAFICVGDGVWIEAGSAVLSAITSITSSFPVVIGGTATIPDVQNKVRGCLATTSDGTSIGAFTNTPIIWDNPNEYDTDSIHSPTVNNTRFNIPAGATYAKVHGLIVFVNSTGIEIFLRGDGVAPEIRGSRSITSQLDTNHNFSTAWVDVTGLAYLEVFVLTDTTRSLDATDNRNYVNVEFK